MLELDGKQTKSYFVESQIKNKQTCPKENKILAFTVVVPFQGRITGKLEDITISTVPL